MNTGPSTLPTAMEVVSESALLHPIITDNNNITIYSNYRNMSYLANELANDNNCLLTILIPMFFRYCSLDVKFVSSSSISISQKSSSGSVARNSSQSYSRSKGVMSLKLRSYLEIVANYIGEPWPSGNTLAW